MQPLIYHNPNCGTSRNTLALIEAPGETPEIVEYLKNSPSRERLLWLLDAAEMPPCDLLRRKGTSCDALGLDDPALADDQLIDVMLAHLVLINRPIVVTDKRVRLCRPSERVLDLLVNPVASFTKEDSELVTHAKNA